MTTSETDPEYSTTGTAIYDSEFDETAQRTALTSGEVPFAVYGLGKMGLPLAAVLADTFGNVTGVDIDEAVVDRINDGDCHVKREPGLPELVSETVRDGSLRATTDPAWAASEASVHVLIVPTLLDDENRPDLSMLDAAIDSVAAGLSTGDLVIVESTVPPGTCEDHVLPRLESESGLAFGEFGLAFCPERTASGQAIEDIRGSYPKVVGGVDEESGRVASLLYRQVTDNEVRTVDDATTAETIKVFEGVYRDIDIAIANQLALYADELGVDVHEIREVANTIPYCDMVYPGPGVGGHCIPVYPHFMLGTRRTNAPLLDAAREINNRMPSFVVGLVQRALSEHDGDLVNSTVLLLGVTYRANIEEIRNAPSLAVAEQLRGFGAEVLALDPMLDDWSEIDATPVTLGQAATREIDAVVLLTAHDGFAGLSFDSLEPTVVVDTRNALDADDVAAPLYTLGRR